MLFAVLRYMNGVIFMLHTVFFLSTEHTDTHGFFPQSEVFKRILVKDFIWELVAYGKMFWSSEDRVRARFHYAESRQNRP